MENIILEGIATSGKSTVQNHLETDLSDKGHLLKLISEKETLMPLLHNTDCKISIEFLKELYNKYDSERKVNELFLFDRFYFTHIFRTQSSVQDFQEFENILKHQSLTVLLTIQEDQILDRIHLARSHRSQQWNDYVSSKGSDSQIAMYYITQQRILLDICKESVVPYIVVDTTDMNFKQVMDTIQLRLKMS